MTKNPIISHINELAFAVNEAALSNDCYKEHTFTTGNFSPPETKKYLELKQKVTDAAAFLVGIEQYEASDATKKSAKAVHATAKENLLRFLLDLIMDRKMLHEKPAPRNPWQPPPPK